MLFVALPIALFAFLLYMANKRAQAQLDAEKDVDDDTDRDPTDSTPRDP
jgi:hypothetical protein